MADSSSERSVRVFLVDGTYELFRNYFAAPREKSTSGEEVGAIRGLLRSLLMLIRSREVEYIAYAFDHVIESFRNRLFPGYKTSEGVDEILLEQFQGAEDAVRALGVLVWPMIEFEADDALATAAAQWREDDRVKQIILCSADKDLCQCVRNEEVVCWNRRTDVVLDEEGVIAKFGLPPRLIPDWLALVGDSADGIPGIAGWGAKNTARILNYYGHIENIPSDSNHWEISIRGAERLARSLFENLEQALLYRSLTTLRTDVDLNRDLDDLHWSEDSASDFEEFCDWLGDRSLVESFQKVIHDRKIGQKA